MKLIVAVDKKWGIGRNNDLLFSIPEDMKFFRSTTLNKVVVMGRKTLESFPNGNPLKNRINIVLTNDKSYSKEGAEIVHSVQEVAEAINDYNTDEQGEVEEEYEFDENNEEYQLLEQVLRINNDRRKYFA